MLKAREGRYGLQPVHKSSRIIRPLGPEVCSSHLLLRKTVPQGLKATRMTTFMPGINPRPTLEDVRGAERRDRRKAGAKGVAGEKT